MWHIINTNYVKDCGTMSNVVKSKVGKIEKRQRTIMCKRSKKSQCNISTKFPTNEILPSSPILPEQRTLGGVRMELQRFYIFAKTEQNMKKKCKQSIIHWMWQCVLKSVIYLTNGLELTRRDKHELICSQLYF